MQVARRLLSLKSFCNAASEETTWLGTNYLRGVWPQCTAPCLLKTKRISESPSNQLLNAADDLGLFRSHSTQETMRADIRPHKGFSAVLSLLAVPKLRVWVLILFTVLLLSFLVKMSFCILLQSFNWTAPRSAVLDWRRLPDRQSLPKYWSRATGQWPKEQNDRQEKVRRR